MNMVNRCCFSQIGLKGYLIHYTFPSLRVSIILLIVMYCRNRFYFSLRYFRNCLIKFLIFQASEQFNIIAGLNISHLNNFPNMVVGPDQILYQILRKISQAKAKKMSSANIPLNLENLLFASAE